MQTKISSNITKVNVKGFNDILVMTATFDGKTAHSVAVDLTKAFTKQIFGEFLIYLGQQFLEDQV